jgi:hypothetical protein
MLPIIERDCNFDFAALFFQIKTQELTGGAERCQSILGFYILVHLAIAISAAAHHPLVVFVCDRDFANKNLV